MSTHSPPSPATTTSSLASYDVVSPSAEDSDDIIVWGLSDSESSQQSSLAMASSEYDSDDFVLLRMPVAVSARTAGGSGSGSVPFDDFGTDLAQLVNATATPVTPTSALTTEATPAEELADSLARLVIFDEDSRSLLGTNYADLQEDGTKSVVDSKCQAANPIKYQSATGASKASPIIVVAGGKKSRSAKKRAKKRKAEKAQALRNAYSGSETPESVDSPTSTEDQTRLFEEASNYITTYLTHPEAKENQVCKLTLLQSLLIELGLAKVSSALPTSLRAATLIIKTTVFINIKEYLVVRKQGPDAILSAMYPSRSALVKAMRKKANRAPLQWVKDHGLNVLLVSCFR